MAYQVVRDIVPGADPETPWEPKTLQLNAPEGMFVTSTYCGVAGSEDGYTLRTPQPYEPGGGRPVVDGQGRVTGFVFVGSQMSEGVSPDIDVAIICVG